MTSVLNIPGSHRRVHVTARTSGWNPKHVHIIAPVESEYQSTLDALQMRQKTKSNVGKTVASAATGTQFKTDSSDPPMKDKVMLCSTFLRFTNMPWHVIWLGNNPKLMRLPGVVHPDAESIRQHWKWDARSPVASWRNPCVGRSA